MGVGSESPVRGSIINKQIMMGRKRSRMLGNGSSRSGSESYLSKQVVTQRIQVAM